MPRSPRSLSRRSEVSSRVRIDVLLAIDTLGEGYASEVGRIARVKPHRVREAVFGYKRSYSKRLGWKQLALVRVRSAEGILIYSITALGRARAASLRKRLLERLQKKGRVRP